MESSQGSFSIDIVFSPFSLLLKYLVPSRFNPNFFPILPLLNTSVLYIFDSDACLLSMFYTCGFTHEYITFCCRDTSKKRGSKIERGASKAQVSPESHKSDLEGKENKLTP